MALIKGNDDMIKAYMHDPYAALMGILVNGETSLFLKSMHQFSSPLQRFCASKIKKEVQDTIN